jgi:hypothetical protein
MDPLLSEHHRKSNSTIQSTLTKDKETWLIRYSSEAMGRMTQQPGSILGRDKT